MIKDKYKLRDIEESKGYFTSKNLEVYGVQNMIYKYRSEGLIRKIQEATSDGTSFYLARYQVMK